MIKGAVCHGDMTCFIFVVGTVHPDIDRLAAVHEGQIFKVDETAVDAETDPVSEKRDAGLVCGGKVNKKPFFCRIVIKCPRQFPYSSYVGDTLQFDT